MDDDLEVTRTGLLPRAAVLLLPVLLLLAGCPPPPSQGTVFQEIGPRGGTLRHPSGAVLRVPEGALLAREVQLTITLEEAPESQTLGATPLSNKAYFLGPESQKFLVPVELELPFDAALLPSGTDASAARVLHLPHAPE